MYLVVIAWLYVVLMMAVAEATNTTGTLLGAIVTFVLYGLLPMSIVVYILGTPGRKRRIREREAAEHEATMKARAETATAEGSVAPDEGGETPADAVAPVREKP